MRHVPLEVARTMIEARLRDDYSDLEAVEVRAFISALVTTFDLASLDAGLDQGQRHPVGTFSPIGKGFDYQQLSREELVQSLEAASGLKAEACGHALGELERRIVQELNSAPQVKLEALGVFELDTTGGLVLHLNEGRVLKELATR